MVTSGLLNTKVFWNKGYDVTIYIYDVTKKNYHVTQNIL